ncbi:hypothetical protein PDK93_22080 [Bacillus cereus]|nr:hypothetical protein [Bacillus cereus]
MKGDNMFNTNELQDKIGYERWLLKDYTTRLEHFLKLPSSRTVTFHLSGLQMHQLKFQDSFGQQDVQKIIEKLSPLIFVTTYKCLDMVFEWILQANLKEVPYQFAKKIQILNTKKNTIKLPIELQLNIDLFNIYLKFYDVLRVYRNSVTHGAWGDNVNGNLSFDFTLNGRLFQKNISFEEIINLAESILLLTDLLIKKENIEYTVTTIKFLLNQLTNIHQLSKFNVQSPLIFKVIYEVDNQQTIDLDEIRHNLKDQAFNHPFYFSLRLISKSQQWEINADYLQNLKEISIDSSIKNFKI